MSRRLLLGYLGLTLLVLVVLEVPLGITIARRERDRLATELERDAFVLASLVEDVLQSGGTLDTEPVSRYVAATGARVVVVDREGVGLLDTDAPEPGRRVFVTREEFAAALDGQVSQGTRSSSTLGTGLFYVAVPVASGGTVHGAVRVTYPSSTVDARVRRSWLALGGVAGVSLLAAAVAGLALARSVSGPLRRLEAAADALGEGALDTRAPEDAGPPEVRSLARSFNDMGARLQELVASQDAFVADASHQLRNPLTALRLRLENLAAEVPGSAAGEVDAALEEVARLSRTVAGLLTLARADRGSGEVAPLDVAALLHERRTAWLPLAAERELSLRVAVPDGLPPALATADRLVQILDNLLANALEVAPAGTEVVLAAEEDGGRVAVHVLDQGPGMTAPERERAFDRFWRGDGGARAASLGGTGLGLAIVRKLALADGAEVALDAAAGGGLDAVVRFRTA